MDRGSTENSKSVTASTYRTILVGVRKESAVVMAADKFEGGWGGEDTSSKLIPHPTLPLCVGLAGLSELKDPRSGRNVGVTDWVQRLTAELTTAAQLDFGRIAAAVANRLQPFIRETLRQPGAANDPRTHVDVLIGYVRGTGQTSLGMVRIGATVEQKSFDTYLDVPESLKGFYSSGNYASDQARFGTNLSDPTFVANHVRRVVADGIAEEARLNSGTNVECGSAIEVALINTKGARIL